MLRKLLIQILPVIMVIGLVGCSLFMQQAIPSSNTSAILETIASPSSRLSIDRAAGIATLRERSREEAITATYQTPTVSIDRTQVVNATFSPSPITLPIYGSTPRNTPTPPASLMPDSPWFVDIGDFRDDLLVLMRPDGTGRWEIMVGSSVYIDKWKDPVSGSLDISPSGEWIVLEHDTSSNGDLHYQEKFLSLVNLTDGEVHKLPLFDSDFPADLTENRESEAAGAVWRARPIWSPNGRYLAYVAVIDGPSADLYIYDTESGSRRRLSSGPNQLWLEPGWSPDGKWVVHEEWFDFYHPDEGVWLDTETCAVWAASLDGSQMNRLFNPFDPITGGGHFYPGWILPYGLVFYDYMYTISFNARVVDITSGVIKPLIPFFETDDTDIDEEFNDLDVDPETGVVAFTYSDYAASLRGLEAGLYFVHLNEEQSQLALPGDWHSVRWIDEISSFLRVVQMMSLLSI